MGLAVSFVLQQDLATSRNIIPLFAVDQSSAYLSGANEALRMTIERRDSSLRLSATSYDLRTQRAVKVFEAQSHGAEDLLTAIEEIAKQLGSQPLGRFSTGNSAALKPFTEAAVAQNPQARAQLLQAAIKIDPTFGLAQIALAETLGPAALGNFDESGFSPFDKTRLEALKLRLTNAPSAQQMDAQRAILKLAPNNVDALATLATLEFLAGDHSNGERMLKQAISLNPSNLALQIQLQRLQQQVSNGKQ